ncbi:15358_t:CDS:2, partial [Rhizophagus irregularis]
LSRTHESGAALTTEKQFINLWSKKVPMAPVLEDKLEVTEEFLRERKLNYDHPSPILSPFSNLLFRKHYQIYDQEVKKHVNGDDDREK